MKRKQFLSSAMALLMAISGSGFAGLATAPMQTLAANPIEVSTSGNTITIGNNFIERTFSLEDNKLSTASITNKRTDGKNTVFIPGEHSKEFIIRTTKDADASSPAVEALDRTGWTATADSYQNATGDADGNAPNLIDGKINSIWHTNYGSGQGDQQFPYNVTFTLNGTKNFQAFSYTPRQESESVNGNIKGYELWAATADDTLSVDSDQWKKISEGNFTYDGVNPIYVNLDKEISANQLKFVAVSSNNGNTFAGGSEFNLHPTAVVSEGSSREFSSADLTLKGNPEVKNTTATINDIEKTGKKITFQFEPYEYKNVQYTISENIVMYEGDHFMRKYLEISVPEDKKEEAVIDYIDLESFEVNASDAQWTIPTDAGGIVQMEQFKANLGQPIYIQGMFFGCEFPATDTQIVNETGYMRYYTGKSFSRLEKDNQLTTDGKYVTWQTVAGAARSTENEVIQADFFDYINSIATPSEFRIQYNSWFDNMMLISDENILESFIEIDKELNRTEVRPLDSYVIDDGWNNYNYKTIVDEGRSGNTLNETDFWALNSKFPEGLTPSSELVHKFGSNFGVWVGPRGGYNFYEQLADLLTDKGTGSKAGRGIDVADRTYVKKFQEMAVDWQKKYDVNYWKWDGFADMAQYNHFPAADGVPGYANRHMTGGYHHMYHVTDLWEAWIDLMEAVRQSEKDDGINNLWISLTCYVNPSPWYLQWANSVWLQCTHDQNDAGPSTSKMDRQITYRDACYYDFLKNHEFQFPLANIYNHDPIYGVEGTEMNINTATDEQFQNYLYMLSTRGTAFWELYFSDSIMTEGKYEVTGEFLAWAEDNFHMLRNAKIFGGSPNTGTVLGDSANGENNTYGFSCFDGSDGLISLRNPSSSQKEISFTFDRTMGVPEDVSNYKYHLEHTHNLTEGTAFTGELAYGETYTFTLKPDEVRILRISKHGDTSAPSVSRISTDGDKTILVKFDEKVKGQTFNVEGAQIASVTQSADDVTYRIELTETPDNAEVLAVTAEDITDLAGNKAAASSVSVTFYKNNLVASASNEVLEGTTTLTEKPLHTQNGFTVFADVATETNGSLVSQKNGYDLGITEDGKAYFTVNGATATSASSVNDGSFHNIAGIKENNGILKLYVDGELEDSAYKAENHFFEVLASAITLGNDSFNGSLRMQILDTAYGYDDIPGIKNLALNKPVAVRWADTDANATETTDRPTTMAVDGIINTDNYCDFGADGDTRSSYLQVDLENVYPLNSFNLYRYWKDGRTYDGTVIAVAEKESDFASGNAVVVYNSDSEDFHGFGAGNESTYAESSKGKNIIAPPNTKGRYVRIYMHGQDDERTTNHIVELQVFGQNKPFEEELVEFPSDVLRQYAKANSEQNPQDKQDGPATWAFDDEAHWWHSRWKGDPAEHEVESGLVSESNPIWLQTGFGKVAYVKEITYLPRQGEGYGRINSYEIQAANLNDPTADPTDADFKVVKSGNLDNQDTISTIKLDTAVPATHIRLVAKSVYGNGGSANVAAQRVKVYTIAMENPEPPVTLKKITVKAPTKTEYEIGEELNLTGMTVTATYSNGTTKDVTKEAQVTGFDSETAGEKTITVTYDGKTATFNVTVKEKEVPPAALENITVTAPTKTEYEIGEELNLTGMTVTATYSNGTTKDVTKEAQVTGFDSETAGEKIITVTYDGKTATFKVTVKEKEEPQPPVDKVDKAALNAAIKDAEGKKEEDYTAESWKAFAEALEAAKKTAKDEKASQTEVDAAKDALVKAQEALVKAGDDTDTPIEEIFDDVREGDWYYEYVDWAYKNKIMTGYGNSDSFGPANTLNRAEFAKILYNYAGTPKVEFEEVLKDVKEGDWYADAVIWAYGEGVITGYTDTKTFGATDEITREQIATILYRYAGEPAVENKDVLETYPDAKKVSDFAKNAMMWATENEIITGDHGNLNPGGNANRAEAATIMQRAIPILESK